MPKVYQHKTIAGFFSAHRDRWIKGEFEKTKRGQVCFCLVGKTDNLYLVPDNERAIRSIKAAIKKLFPITYSRLASKEKNDRGFVISFNDANHRTIQDIIDVAREAGV